MKLGFKFRYDHIKNPPMTQKELRSLLKEIDESEAYMLKHFSPKRHKLIKEKSEEARRYFSFIYGLCSKEVMLP